MDDLLGEVKKRVRLSEMSCTKPFGFVLLEMRHDSSLNIKDSDKPGAAFNPGDWFPLRTTHLDGDLRSVRQDHSREARNSVPNCSSSRTHGRY